MVMFHEGRDIFFVSIVAFGYNFPSGCDLNIMMAICYAMINDISLYINQYLAASVYTVDEYIVYGPGSYAGVHVFAVCIGLCKCSVLGGLLIAVCTLR